MSARVRFEREADVAVLIVDDTPVNAVYLAVHSEIVTAIGDLGHDAEIGAVVIMGAGGTFIPGAHLLETGEPVSDPQLLAVIRAIEFCGKPVVAALHGAVLGGAFELALGCDARIALAGTVIGLPEVSLGVIPGAGGTQRLPRLAGIPWAIRMIAGTERAPADTALMLGLIDQIVAARLREAAVAWARKLTGSKARVRDREVPPCDEGLITTATAHALRAGKNRPAVRAAIQAVLAAGRLPFEQGLAHERAEFQTLFASREARALRHLFIAEREAARIPGLDGAVARPVQQIAVIGAGTMGAGIAISALDAGLDVSLLEQTETALQAGAARIRSHYESRLEAGKIDAIQAQERLQRLKARLDWVSAVADADLVIEAVFEDLKVKQDVFRRLDELARPGAILASNTSYIDLDAIAAVTARAQDVVGLHFFSPAHVMRLLEVVRGAVTSPDVLATGIQLAGRLHKIPVVAANAFGFIGNRVYAAYRRQCEFLLEEGASPQQVDAALEAFGFAMGPFAVGDMSGLDIAWRMRQSLAATRDPKARYVHIPDMLCEAGRLGRKSGAGYYAYGQAGGARQPDPVVEQIIVQARAAKGIAPRAIGAQEIVERALLSMSNEAALLLQQGVAQRGGDIDVVMVNGYGFPKWEGGPVFWARERSAEELQRDLDWLADLSGLGFIRGDLQQLFA